MSVWVKVQVLHTYHYYVMFTNNRKLVSSNAPIIFTLSKTAIRLHNQAKSSSPTVKYDHVKQYIVDFMLWIRVRIVQVTIWPGK